MKRIIALSLALLCTTAADADPTADLAQFQEFFRKKFPEVAIADFANGVYAIDKALRADWETAMQLPPYEPALENGKKIWETPFTNGKTFAACFKNGGKNIAQHYPYWHEGRQEVRTLELDINECRRRNNEPEFTDWEKGPLAEVAAYMKSLARGQNIEIDLSKPGAVAAYEEGKKYYWSRRGQLNFACANCHMGNAGKKLRGDTLSPTLGHGLGWPAYRAEWGDISTLHRRYSACHIQTRAKPLPPQSRAYRNLELYETYMSTGLPLTAPSQRY